MTGSSGILMKNVRSLTRQVECSSMGRGFKNRPIVVKALKNPLHDRFISDHQKCARPE
jgi:hypothetical protein